MKTLTQILAISTLILLSHPLFADDKTPPAAPASAKPILYELAKVKGADVEIKEDAKALGGEYVMNRQAYNPVVFLNTPAGDGFAVWARVRGSSFQLKAVIGGKQQELDWVWGTPGEFVWKKFGTYPRAKLGDQFVIIRGDKADATDGIDAVLISPDPNFSPDTEKDIEKLLAH